MTDELYMQRALELAKLGSGVVSPNPIVGCVIVNNGKIIGEGYHQKCGEAHAEVKAVKSVKDRNLLSSSTVYVTLEPCAHHGKTPPCADMLVRESVKKVVIATKDTFAKVNGLGIKTLEDAGIEVEVGLMEAEALELNKRFFTYHEKKRPYVILKWAQTADGFIARKNYDSKWISNQFSRQLVHKWRSEEDAILVGKNTAIYDNPSLTTRDWNGSNPIRVLLDRNLEVVQDSTLFDDHVQTLIFNQKENSTKGKNEWICLENFTVSAILTALYEKRIQSVIIEGGAKVLNSFIAKNCWDEARVFTSNTSFGVGMHAPLISGCVIHEEHLAEDQLKILSNYG